MLRIGSVATAAVVVALGAGSVYLWERLIATKTAEPQAHRSQYTDVPADWKTFRNNEFGYSVQYPIGWSVSQQNMAEVSFTKNTPESGIHAITIAVHRQQTMEFVTAFKQAYPDGCPTDEETALGGMLVRRIVCIEAFAGNEEVAYFFEQDREVYVLSYARGDEKLNQTFEQIVRSFRFD